MISSRLRALLLSCLFSACLSVSAQSWPSKPIKLVVGFAPGGAADHVARSMGDAFGRALGASVVVENRAGAGSSIAAEFVANHP